MMRYLDELSSFFPSCEQEERDLSLILALCQSQGSGILHRDCLFAHLVSSGFVLNRDGTHALLIYHRQFEAWSYPGGHCDGGTDLLAVAMRETKEETGARAWPLCDRLCAVDVLPVAGHWRRGAYVSAHLHLNASFLLLAESAERLAGDREEVGGARWLALSELPSVAEAHMLPIYQKLLKKAGITL